MFIQSLVNRLSQSGQTRFYRDLGAIALGLMMASLALTTQGAELNINESAATEKSLDAGANPTIGNGKIATSRGFSDHPYSATGKAAPMDNEVTTKPRSIESGQPAMAKSGSYHDFEIFDADVTLYFDDDYDGHYYGIDVNFDADTDYAAADVYARLYLSLEGGPWELYYTTEIFTLIGDIGGDDYTVETELYSGYPTAYYDVLIELYDADTGDFVAEFGPEDSLELKNAPLEDQQRDAGYINSAPAPIISHSHGGGGSTSLLVLALLSLALAVRRHASGRPEVQAIQHSGS